MRHLGLLKMSMDKLHQINDLPDNNMSKNYFALWGTMGRIMQSHLILIGESLLNLLYVFSGEQIEFRKV